VRVYRVFPHRDDADPGEAGHALYVQPDQGLGRWDNPELYRVLYLAASAAGTLGETFAHLTRWSTAMLPFPAVAGARRRLAVYHFDETVQPCSTSTTPRPSSTGDCDQRTS
jgi:hypothetical protein